MLANSDYYKQYQLFVDKIAQYDYDGLSRLSLELPKCLELWRKWAFDLMWYHQKGTPFLPPKVLISSRGNHQACLAPK